MATRLVGTQARYRQAAPSGVRPHALLEHYALTLGWPMMISEGQICLPTNLGIVGLSTSVGIGGEVAGEFARRDLNVPILAVPGHPNRWVFLVETPAGPWHTFPAWVNLLAGPTMIPLPPSSTEHGPVRWVIEPNGGRVPAFQPSLNAMRRVAQAGSL